MSNDSTVYTHTNHLIDENSPYLLSHAHNPVNWYPWGDEALTKAREEDKPIFLSIGYAACHWCHVMERESFESDEVADILNQHYVSIKVDREQRPDLDHIYMAFTQAMTGSGGWPMSVFLTPDLKPFYAGTYFPPEDRYGRPGFKSLITEIARVYAEDRESLTNASEDIFQKMSAVLNRRNVEGELSRGWLENGVRQLMRGFDHANGGFGRAPKFPHATELSLFLRHADNSDEKAYRDAALRALKAMAQGGIYDHLGGGFARYSTDEKWLVPHFEKMLYDNGLLVPDYVDAYRLTGDSVYLKTTQGVLDWILREMTDHTGGFYSALDADSEGEEGKFYVWDVGEIKAVLGDDAKPFMEYYNVTSGGNFEGKNILNLTGRSDAVRKEMNRDDFDDYMAALRKKLLNYRAKRVRPLTDDKILASWNGLAVTALCRGYQVTGDDRYLDAARQNAEFVKRELFRDGHLTHSYREGKHSRGQFLEDYGYYLPALIELYQADAIRGDEWLAFAGELADRAIDLFMDDNGALYLRDSGQADLIVRPKDETDAALPSAGSLLIQGLLKLSQLTGDEKYRKAADKALKQLATLMQDSPGNMASALIAVDYHLGDKVDVVLVGDSEEREKMLAEVWSRYLPNLLVAVSDSGLSKLPLFEGRKAEPGKTTAYVCVNSACQLPVQTVEELRAQLDQL